MKKLIPSNKLSPSSRDSATKFKATIDLHVSGWSITSHSKSLKQSETATLPKKSATLGSSVDIANESCSLIINIFCPIKRSR